MWYPAKQNAIDNINESKQYINNFIYISFWIKITDSHAKVEKVVNEARNPVSKNVFKLADIKILFSISPINTPNIKDPNMFTINIAIGISKNIKCFNVLLER